MVFCCSTLLQVTRAPEIRRPTFPASTYFQGKCKTSHLSHLRNAYYWGLGLTWGTHLGDTKLVASITGSPASESMSISLIFVEVDTKFCNAERNTRKDRLATVGIKWCRTQGLLVQSFATACTSLSPLPDTSTDSHVIRADRWGTSSSSTDSILQWRQLLVWKGANIYMETIFFYHKGFFLTVC